MGKKIFATDTFTAWERKVTVDGSTYSKFHVLLKNGDRVSISDKGLVSIDCGGKTAVVNLEESYLLAQLCNGVEIQTTSSFQYEMDGFRISSPKGGGKKRYKVVNIAPPKKQRKRKRKKKRRK